MPVKPCEMLTYFRQHENHSNISIVAVMCHCPTRDKHHSDPHWPTGLQLSCRSSGLRLQLQICLEPPACLSYLQPCFTSDCLLDRHSDLLHCNLRSKREDSRSMSWPHLVVDIISDVCDQWVFVQKGCDI